MKCVFIDEFKPGVSAINNRKLYGISAIVIDSTYYTTYKNGFEKAFENLGWTKGKELKGRYTYSKAIFEGISVEKRINFGKKWTDVPLNERMDEIGFPNKDYYDLIVKVTYTYAHVNSLSLLSEINKTSDVKRTKDQFSSQAIYSVTAQMLGHVLKALNIYFKDFFNYYEEIWKQIPGKPNARESFEKAQEKIQTNKK